MSKTINKNYFGIIYGIVDKTINKIIYVGKRTKNSGMCQDIDAMLNDAMNCSNKYSFGLNATRVPNTYYGGGGHWSKKQHFKPMVLSVVKTQSANDLKDIIKWKELFYIKKYKTHSKGFNKQISGKKTYVSKFERFKSILYLLELSSKNK